MIKLSVEKHSSPVGNYPFNKDVIIIGSGETVDLNLQDPAIQEIHLEISKVNGRYYALNRANDPFATVNHLPFGRKQINSQDVIQLGPYTIHFEIIPIEETDLEPSSFETQDKEELPIELSDTAIKIPELLDTLLATKAQSYTSQSIFLPYTNPTPEIHSSAEKSLEEIQEMSTETFQEEEIDIEALMQEVENLELAQDEQVEEILEKTGFNKKTDFDSQNEPFIPVEDITPSLSSIIELEEESALLKGEKEEYEKLSSLVESESRKYEWSFWIGVTIAFLTLLGLIISAIYIHIVEKSDEEEIKAAEGVADVSMALKYAQIHHIKPQKQNWSDPEFLKNSLSRILPQSYPSLTNIDAEGHFNNTPYILRLYTSGDFSQFLVIAQPAPSMLQWLIPKSAIVVDSRIMEMRKISDFRTLNRLLVTTDNLEGDNAQEITQLVKQGKLIPLSFLVNKKRDLEFSPPKALSYFHPGAENLIYNAPRYHPLGENLMERAVSLVALANNNHEISRLKQEMNVIAEMPNFIMYSSQGMEFATKAQNALSMIVPNIKFLTAYLKLSSKGKIGKSHLLIDDDNSQVALRDFSIEKNLAIQSESNSEEPSLLQHEREISHEYEHPLYLQLATLASDRQKAFHEISDQWIQLLKDNALAAVPDFSEKMTTIALCYQQILTEQQEKFAQRILELSYESQEMPMEQFVKYIQAEGLKTSLDEMLFSMSQQYNDERTAPEQIEILRGKIQKAPDFIELDRSVVEIAALLTISRFPNIELLIDYQDKVHRDVIQKLNLFLIQPDIEKSFFTFSDQDRTALIHTLKTAWMNEEAEFEFYLSEFDNIARDRAVTMEIKPDTHPLIKDSL